MQFHEFLICVATVNGPKRLEDFIKSIIEHTVGLDYRISITDDCSDVALSQQNYALAAKYGCYYTRNEKRSGVPFSWNRAIQLADAKTYIVSNDDIEVVDGWLHAYDAFRRANSQLNLGVIAWPATNIKDQLTNSGSFTVGVDSSHIVAPIVACAGYLFGFSKEIYQSVGGFDERYFATWEEIDFGAKLCMNGLKSVGLNAPIIYHEGGASFSDPINQHPAMQKQSLAQTQWIDKWSTILNISKHLKSDRDLIIEISNSLILRLPILSESSFKSVEIDVKHFSQVRVIEPREDIHGWFDWSNIYSSALNTSPLGAKFVEVGSWMGKSACFMAEIIKESGKQIEFNCVDIWDESYAVDNETLQNKLLQSPGSTLLDLFKDNLKRYGVLDYVKIHKTTSALAAKNFESGSLDMVFLDAAHDYESVKVDLNSWCPKLKHGAIFAGHDYFWSSDGVKPAVDEFFAAKGISIQTSGQCWVVKIP